MPASTAIRPLITIDGAAKGFGEETNATLPTQMIPERECGFLHSIATAIYSRIELEICDMNLRSYETTLRLSGTPGVLYHRSPLSFIARSLETGLWSNDIGSKILIRDADGITTIFQGCIYIYTPGMYEYAPIFPTCIPLLFLRVY